MTRLHNTQALLNGALALGVVATLGFVNHKMYLHGGGGNQSAKNEGYSTKPDYIPPHDCYGESCSVFANF